MRLRILFYCLLFCLSLSAQDQIARDAKYLKENNKEVWYADGKFGVEEITMQQDTSSKKERIKATPEMDYDFISHLFRYLSIIVLVVTALLLLYNLRFRFKKLNQPVSENISIEDDPEDITQLNNVDFKSKITQAETAGNFRLAVRWYYLWLIHHFCTKGYLVFNKHKTNKQYCYEMRSYPEGRLFENCTMYYNYLWFGEYNVDANGYRSISDTFNQILPI